MNIVNEAISMIRAELGIILSEADHGWDILISSRTAYLTPGGF